MSNTSSLSKRGQKASTSTLRVDMEIFEAAQKNLYHATDNPTGVLLLNMAENNLSWPLLKEKIEAVTRAHGIPHWVSNYTSAMGSPDFRAALASFLSKFLTKCTLDPNHLACSAGATPVVEVSSWILGDAGDVAVFPAPSYPVYTQDIGNKGAMKRYDLITHDELSSIKEGSTLSTIHLDSALKEIQSQGNHFKMLVLTNPDNPTGIMYTKAQLLNIADWCIENEVHLIINEIYGLSLIDTSHSEIAADYPTKIDFYSFAQIMQSKQSDYLHLWYSLSKDIGVSGFRVGAVYSLNTQFLKAYNNINAPHMVSNFTQWVFQLVLSDHDFMEKYIQKNQAVLTESYALVVKYLRKANIPYVPSRGSLFAWIDLSAWLSEQTEEAETELWLDIYKKTKVLITPATGFGNSKRGQYRLVYTSISKTDLEVAMQRLVDYFS